jgi:hypothetical protein
VERLFEEGLEIVQLALGAGSPIDPETHRARLEQLRKDARGALAAGDEQLYRECVESLTSFADAVKRDLSESKPGKKRMPLPEDKAALFALAELRRRIRLIRTTVLAAGRDDLAGQIKKMHRELETMEPRAGTHASAVLAWCQQQQNALQRCEEQAVREAGRKRPMQEGLLSLSGSVGPQPRKIRPDTPTIRRPE